MQIFANGKRCFYSFMVFYVIHSKNQGVKIWYDKNRIFSIKAIVPEIFKFLKICKLAKWDIIHSTKFWSNMMKKDISANLYQKCLILCSKILLNALHNLSLTVLLPWQHTGFQTSPILKAFPATFGIPFSYLQMVPHIHDPSSI